MLPLRRALPALLGALALAGCVTPWPSPAGSPLPSTPAATQEPSGTELAPTPSAVVASPTERSIAEVPPPIALAVVATGLEEPISIAGAPDGSLLVNERGGRVVAVDPNSGETTIALDITDRVLGGGERGLLGLALHPGWPSDPRAFVHYSDLDGDTVLSEFGAADADPPALDPASERVLLRVSQPFVNHNGGQLAFGSDGHLYLGLGDGGAAGDPLGNGQDPGTLLGSILRLDVSVPGRYGIPSDNPFAAADEGAEEVYLHGLRNPWRFSFDRNTGQLWIADVGQKAYEEIDRVEPAADAGANLGWATMEGAQCFSDPGCSSDGLVMPVAEYGRELGCSVTGGYVYRGAAIAGLAGWYLFGDYCSGLLFGVRSDAEGEVRAPRVLLETGAAITTFGEDVDGELYVADLGSGTIYRIVAGD